MAAAAAAAAAAVAACLVNAYIKSIINFTSIL
jgi:NADH/NAD ratio-sensing transcriptional regulator Rex